MVAMPLIMIASLAFEAHHDREDERGAEHGPDVLGAQADRLGPGEPLLRPPPRRVRDRAGVT